MSDVWLAVLTSAGVALIVSGGFALPFLLVDLVLELRHRPLKAADFVRIADDISAGFEAGIRSSPKR